MKKIMIIVLLLFMTNIFAEGDKISAENLEMTMETLKPIVPMEATFEDTLNVKLNLKPVVPMIATFHEKL